MCTHALSRLTNWGLALIITHVPAPEDTWAVYALLGRRIADARVQSRIPISQTDLAQRSGLSRGSIANIEAGRQRPPIETIWRIAAVLNVDPRELLPSLEEVHHQVRASRSVAIHHTRVAQVTGASYGKVADFLLRQGDGPHGRKNS